MRKSYVTLFATLLAVGMTSAVMAAGCPKDLYYGVRVENTSLQAGLLLRQDTGKKINLKYVPSYLKDGSGLYVFKFPRSLATVDGWEPVRFAINGTNAVIDIKAPPLGTYLRGTCAGTSEKNVLLYVH